MSGKGILKAVISSLGSALRSRGYSRVSKQEGDMCRSESVLLTPVTAT